VGGRVGAIAPEAIIAELERILASEDFDASDRNRRFLRHVVEETLGGRADRIKAYSIATSVFGRDQSFDPQNDPIIRIEAGRLRRSLEHYYLTAGQQDAVLIAVPKGSYVPVFQTAPDELPVADPGATQNGAEAPIVAVATSAARPWRLTRSAAMAGALWIIGLIWLGVSWIAGYPPFSQASVATRHGPAIFVVPFEEGVSEAAHLSLAKGFTREIIVGLTRFNDLFVYGPETSLRYGETSDPSELPPDLEVDFMLTGDTTISSGRFAVAASLIDVKTGRYIWSGKFDGNLTASDVVKARDEIADEVVRTLAQPYGVIFNEKVRESQGKPPQSLTSYDCILQFYQYWRSYRQELHEPVRQCLEAAIVADPDYSEAFAALSLIHVDAYRFGYRVGIIAGDPRQEALRLARRAVELAPNSARSYQALHLAYWTLNDVDRSLDAAKIGLSLNPNDTELMADLGLRYCLRAQWEKGVPLVRQALERNPAQPSVYRLSLFLHAYVNGRYEEALAEAIRMDAQNVIYTQVALAMAYGQLGRTEDASAAISKILAIDPAYGDHLIADLKKRNVHPDLARAVVDGLRKAGLAVRSTLAQHEP
jgi:adenylate cyclase